ncbi:DsbA family protein [Microbacterium dauci]|uniref:Thioredoxin domain-containing protein n=1 Tax=Microbacterium dauci TaxID=3048008 RepID=A0ABT6ZE27_9MICO|nr:thioredoxin domain-containing protein [Microbacterium sp. LX3-4]MDJ1114416.1 thioredoxin domain-containing protein [Microbacterium sp. LX3-4]
MAAAAGKTNWFAVWISVAVVAVLAIIIALVVVMNGAASAPAARPDSAGIDESTGAVVIGTGETQVDVYVDFYCPHCQDFEDIYGADIEEQLEAGAITLNVHPVALSGLNAASGTDFSKRASNAMYCVAEAEPTAAFPFYVDVFGQKPSGAGLTDEQLVTAAEAAGAPGAADCIADRTWDDLVAEQTSSIPEDPVNGGAGTPTLLVDGEYVNVTGDVEADLLSRIG